MKIKYPQLLLATAAMLATSAQAAIIKPISASSISAVNTTSDREIISTIDGSSLFDGSGITLPTTPFTATGLTAFAGTLTEANITTVVAAYATTFTSNGYWLSGSTAMGGTTISTTELLTFNFDQAYDLDTIYAWNYGRDGSGTRAIKTFDIAWSTDNGASWTDDGPATAASASSLGITDLTNHPQTGSPGAEAYAPVDVRNFNSTIAGVTNIRFSSLESHGSTGFVGLAEIRFGGTAIPEPSTTALLGLGGLALILRRRK